MRRMLIACVGPVNVTGAATGASVALDPGTATMAGQSDFRSRPEHMNPMTCLLPIGAAMAVLAGTAMAQEVVFDADFEVESGERPPAGWTMWGPQKDKDPANYTRDAAKPSVSR